MEIKKRSYRTIIIGIAFFFPFMSVIADDSSKSSYLILDSGIWVEWNGSPNLFWLDNNRVLFNNSAEKDKSKHRQGKFNISIWDTVTNKISSYSEYAKKISMCYHDGFIYYTLEDEKGKQERFSGELGKEKSIIPTQNRNIVYNKMDCHFYDDPSLAKLMTGASRHDVKQLLGRDGYLDFGARSDGRVSKSTLYYRKGSDVPISLPNLNRKYIDYYLFKDAYLVRDLGLLDTAWWLYPTGKIEEIKFPDVAYKATGNTLYPTRVGFFVFFYDSSATNFKFPGRSGGYLITDSAKQTQLISGYLNGVSVSPDGCKIAFSHYPYLDATRIDDPGQITLKAINVCIK